MILVQLLGGLGNQMFQYAAGRALAERTGAALRLDVHALHQRGLDTPRPYAVGPFAISAPIATGLELHHFRIQRWFGRAQRLHEKGHAWNSAFEYAGPKTELIGFWQSERYFTAIAPIIRREFTVREAPDARDAALLTRMGAENAVSVHIRRGDYAANPVTNAFHGLISLDYYHTAAEHLTAQGERPQFYVFSDEPAWAREHLRLPGATTIIDHHGPDEAHKDLRLMRACQHHIIANSSFSWWGAWLSERPGKRVIAPRQWFRDPAIDTSDVCPPEWIRL